MSTPDPYTIRHGALELVECVVCGRVGLPERIHGLACPHDGAL